MYAKTPPSPNVLVVDIPQAADRLGSCPTMVRRLVKAGELKYLRIGNRIKIPMTELTDFVQRKAVTNEAA